MKLLLMALVAATFTACEKASDGDDNTTPAPTIIDTVGRVWLEPVRMPGNDTTGNYNSYYGFYKKAGTTLAYYIASSSGNHRVCYVGSESLFHPDSVKSRGSAIISWKIAPALKGTAIFETYDLASGAIYKRYIANKDSVEILASFSTFGDLTTPDRKIGEAFLYYINVKQNDGIKYRKN